MPMAVTYRWILGTLCMLCLLAGCLMPAALSHGIGSETQRPFAVVIVGGLVTATLFTLLLLPLLFPIFTDECLQWPRD
jgi:heavy metal efflux system protein